MRVRSTLLQKDGRVVTEITHRKVMPPATFDECLVPDKVFITLSDQISFMSDDARILIGKIDESIDVLEIVELTKDLKSEREYLATKELFNKVADEKYKDSILLATFYNAGDVDIEKEYNQLLTELGFVDWNFYVQYEGMAVGAIYANEAALKMVDGMDLKFSECKPYPTMEEEKKGAKELRLQIEKIIEDRKQCQI